MDDITLPTNSALDRPDERDVTSEDYRAGTNNSAVEEIIILERLNKIPNQGLDRKYRNSCTRQALASIVRTQHKGAEQIIDETLGFKKWDDAVALNPSILETGDYLQESLKQFMKDKIIGGHYTIKSKGEMLQAFRRGHLIYTGSKNGNWRKVRDERLYDISKEASIGHCFIFAESTMPMYAGLNSYGENNGYFNIPDHLVFTASGNHTGNFFTMYAIMPPDEVGTMLKILAERNTMNEHQKVAYNHKLFNGLRLKDFATESEVQIMLSRFVAILGKPFTREAVANALDAPWSGQNPTVPPTSQECYILIDRVMLQEMTRGNIASVLGEIITVMQK